MQGCGMHGRRGLPPALSHARTNFRSTDSLNPSYEQAFRESSSIQTFAVRCLRRDVLRATCVRARLPVRSAVAQPAVQLEGRLAAERQLRFRHLRTAERRRQAGFPASWRAGRPDPERRRVAVQRTERAERRALENPRPEAGPARFQVDVHGAARHEGIQVLHHEAGLESERTSDARTVRPDAVLHDRRRDEEGR